LIAGTSVITITGLNRPDFPSGQISVLDGSSGANQYTHFGRNFLGDGGTGSWILRTPKMFRDLLLKPVMLGTVVIFL
jgi:hypothetical protein